jgi:hypothetical protein
LTDTRYQSFTYGDCEPAEGEGGCRLPIRGGGLGVAYAPGATDVGTGRQTVSVRASVAEERFDGVATIAKATELPPDEVRLRLRIAELMGPDALAGVPAPTISIATVERWRQLAFGVQTHNLAHTAERHKNVGGVTAEEDPPGAWSRGRLLRPRRRQVA